MKATSGSLPRGDEWAHEIKWDGMRAVVTVRDGRLRITSSTGRDVSVAFPELHGLADALGVRNGVFDGEIVALDGSGRPDFASLQARMHVTDARTAAERSEQVPVTLLIFDLLGLDGNSLLDLPWRERRAALDALIDPGPHWAPSPVHTDGDALLTVTRAQGLEGIVSKRIDAPYRPGTRSSDWVKVKVRHRQEFVVGGWAPGTGARAGTIGGLYLGYHEGGSGPLRFAGRAGSGLSDARTSLLQARMTPVPDCPFESVPESARDAIWVWPDVVVEVEFAEWTPQGRLRHPSIVGVRDDKAADEVTADP